MEQNFKGFDLLNKVLQQNETFKQLVNENMEQGKIRQFGEEEWDKIKKQNYISGNPDLKTFYDIFSLGWNIGNVGMVSRQLSYSYNNVDLVSGFLPLLTGSINSPNGEHEWLENDKEIIDTTLCLIIDKSLKEEMGYQTEFRFTQQELMQNELYRERKEFINDETINRGFN